MLFSYIFSCFECLRFCFNPLPNLLWMFRSDVCLRIGFTANFMLTHNSFTCLFYCLIVFAFHIYNCFQCVCFCFHPPPPNCNGCSFLMYAFRFVSNGFTENFLLPFSFDLVEPIGKNQLCYFFFMFLRNHVTSTYPLYLGPYLHANCGLVQSALLHT